MILKEQLVKTIKECLKKIAISNKDTLKDITKKIIVLSSSIVQEEIKKYLSDINNNLDDFSYIVKEAWNLTEKKEDVLSLNECITLVKKNINTNKHSSAGIFYNKSSNMIDYNYEIHLFFIDHNNNPILDGNSPHWLIYTKELSKELIDSFDDKNMIVLK